MGSLSANNDEPLEQSDRTLPSPDASEQHSSPLRKLLLPLALLTAGCGGREAERAFASEHSAPTALEASDEQLVLSDLENAFLAKLSVPEDQAFFSGIPITVHVNGMLSLDVGTLNFSSSEKYSTQYLKLDVHSTHSQFPEQDVGLEVKDIVEIPILGENSVIGIKFRGTCDEVDEDILVCIPSSAGRGIALDVYASLNLSDMTGDLGKIEAHYFDFLHRPRKLVITGDPNGSKMDVELQDGEGNPLTKKITVKTSRFY